MWDCSCGNSYVLRRCSACGIVSQVSSLQRNGEPWECMWCQAPNSGFATRRDPAEATLGDLAADMAKHGLAFPGAAVGAEPTAAEPADTTPVLIVTMNEIPGYRITAVHGDVFGLVVRARNAFSNLGAQLRTAVGGEVVGYTKLLTASRNQARERGAGVLGWSWCSWCRLAESPGGVAGVALPRAAGYTKCAWG
jgi:hypothetical protein